ncbi:hypothetical protein ODI_R1380 [Orrella dioscoreae]|uniref:Uncharacterized protein n=1 Tax=Orrella dioscoreae TaxID=1851544 RepID=A0A1C3K3V4_9BURK|nr:hypothetical protein ODI_00788 [Orrella dioscoreae]SOE48336.1 hypothetical protein ODI_R1380 [Orrella dioscoreae]
MGTAGSGHGCLLAQRCAGATGASGTRSLRIRLRASRGAHTFTSLSK